MEDGDFEVSAVLWLLKLGQWGLKQGWDVGKATMLILMDEKQD